MTITKETLIEELALRRRLLAEAEESIAMYKDDIERLEEEIEETFSAVQS